MVDQHQNAAPPSDEVVLVDSAGAPTGRAPRTSVHTEDTPLHLAFSSYLFNADGQVLLTRRALGKKTWPGVWTNSCCGHPRPGEEIEDAIRRRVREELGADVHSLAPALPHFRYRATDAGGTVENEICPVFVGRVDTPLAPDPDEVMDHRWVDWQDLVTAADATPEVYSPWSMLQVPQLAARLSRLGTDPDDVADVDDSVAEVEVLLQEQLRELARVWAGHATGLGCDVLDLDLPGWLAELQRGNGKRFRVRMAYWGFRAAGGVPGGPGHRTMLQVATALETLHLFAIIHDDVMDDSDSRRGRPSAHVEAAGWHRVRGAVGDPDDFGRNLALLLGDLAHLHADALIDRLPPPIRQAWYDLCVELIVGQRADLTGAAARRRDLDHAERVARLKSGNYTVLRPLLLGALAAGASEEALAALTGAGEHIGQAFAYRDDILGVWGDPDITGKPSGDDLTEGKATVIVALAHERLTGAEADLLEQLGTPSLTGQQIIHLQDALERAGVRDAVEGLITDHLTQAEQHLGDRVLDPAGAAGLREAARTMAWRQR